MDAIEAHDWAARGLQKPLIRLNGQPEDESRPSLLVLRSHIGTPSPDHTDDPAAHGNPFTAEDVVFTFTVTNKSAESVEITSLSDSVFGVLDGDADCEVGTVLAASGQASVVNISSIDGLVGVLGMSSYTASKFGVTGLTNGGVQVKDLGEIDAKPVFRTRIEFFCGLGVFSGRAAARLTGVLAS